jgi:hypothetical protein
MSEPLGRVVGIGGGRPRKLAFLAISQSAEDLFQRGERVLSNLGTDVDLARAAALGATGSGGPGPALRDLTGGVGNRIRVSLNPPVILADNMVGGQFSVKATLDDASEINCDTTPAPDRFKFDGQGSRDWYGPLGYIGPYLNGDGGGVPETGGGDWTFDFIFADETSASIQFTMAQLHALATAQGVVHISYGDIDVTSLLDPILNASGGKTIDHVTLTKTTAFGSSVSTYVCQMLIRDSGGALRNLLPGVGAMSFLNLKADPSGTVTPSSTFTLANTPEIRMRVWSLASGAGAPVGGLKVPTGRSVTSVAFTRDWPFVFSPTNVEGCTIRIVDSFNTFLGNFSGDTEGTVTASPSDGPAGVDRYLFYRFQIPARDPATVDIPIDAASILAAIPPGTPVLNAQSGTATKLGNGLLFSYAGFTVDEVALVVGDDGAAAQYGPSGLTAPSGITVYFERDTDIGVPAQSIDLRPTVSSYQWPTPPGPAGAVLSGDASIKLDFNFFPKDAPLVAGDLLVTEPYTVKGCRRAAFRFRCVPPMGARPTEYTSPRFKVLALASQGPVDGRILWTPIVVNVQSTEAHGKSGTDNYLSLACYPFVEFLPDDWDGATLSICAAEYAVPWAFVRFLILPDTGDASGYVLSILASADGVGP